MKKKKKKTLTLLSNVYLVYIILLGIFIPTRRGHGKYEKFVGRRFRRDFITVGSRIKNLRPKFAGI